MKVLALLAEILMVGDGRLERDLPAMLQAGIAALGGSAEVIGDQISGAPLEYNFATPSETEALAVLARGQTLALILTETTPLYKAVTWHDPAGAIVQYGTVAKASNGRVRIYFQESWPSLLSATELPSDTDPDAGTPWRARIDKDRDTYRRLAARASADPVLGLPVEVIPTGTALGVLSDALLSGTVPGLSRIEDFFLDDTSPNGRGLYFIAMVQIATLTGKSPEGLPAKLMRSWTSRHDMLSDDQAVALQRIAWQAVSAFKTLPPPDEEASLAAPAQEGASATSASPDAAELPPAPAVDVLDFPAVKNPNLFIGLHAVNDWSTQVPFLNLMKSARPWTGHSEDGKWDGPDYDGLMAQGILNAQGWPVRLSDDVKAVSTLVLTDMPETTRGVRGRYVVRYKGTGTLAIGGRGAGVSSVPGRLLFDFEPGNGGVVITITAMDPADPLRDIEVIREDREGLYDSGEIFNPDWLNRIRGVKGLRFMDWMATNNSTLARAEDRPRPGDFSWAVKGVPVEIMVALANELDADPWLNMPHLGEDALFRDYAAYVRDNLEPGRRVWVEFSNEVWNWIFTQSAWAEENAKSRWGQEYLWVQYAALRASQMADIWTEVFGAASDERLVRVLGVQTGWKGLERDVMDGAFVRADGLPPPSASFDAYGITGYIGGSIAGEEMLPTLRDWIRDSQKAAAAAADAQGLSGDEKAAYLEAHEFDAALAKAEDFIRNGASSNEFVDSIANTKVGYFEYHDAVAKEYGLDLVMYEGGTHAVGYGEALEDETLTRFFGALNYSAEMGRLHQDIQRVWAEVSDQPFNAFVDVAAQTKWGSWGALRHLGDDNPRWRALATECPQC
jgi:hypothetical protein